MKVKLHVVIFILLIAAGFMPTLYWIFDGDSYCTKESNQEERYFKPTINSDIDNQGSHSPKKDSFPERGNFLAGITQADNQNPHTDRYTDGGKREPSNRVIELLCEAKLTDLLLALFTYCLVIVGAYQGWFLLDSGKTARISADAAKKSADVSERALLQSQRALVSVESFSAGPIYDDKKVCAYVIKVTWNNTGVTDAIHVKAGVTYTVTDNIKVHTVQFAHNPIMQNDNMTIGARTASISSTDRVQEGNIRKVWEKKGRLFALARIEYEDVFGRHHHTQFCVEFKPLCDPFIFPATDVFMSNIWKEHHSSN